MRLVKPCLVAILGFGIIPIEAFADPVSIRNTRHNLSSGGQYSVKAKTQNQICIFCHTPHNSDSTEAPLWNRRDTTQTFIMATTQWVNWGRSQTGADSTPTTISKKCLSCHDGSIAVGDLKNNGIFEMENCGTGKLDADCSLKNDATNPFGSYDLRGGHVISFKYEKFYDNCNTEPLCDEGRFKSWAVISEADKKSMFDRQGKMQCHTCHDPHTDRCNDSLNTIGKDPFWRKACDANGNGSVCNTCHNSFSEYTAPNFIK